MVPGSNQVTQDLVDMESQGRELDDDLAAMDLHTYAEYLEVREDQQQEGARKGGREGGMGGMRGREGGKRESMGRMRGRVGDGLATAELHTSKAK